MSRRTKYTDVHYKFLYDNFHVYATTVELTDAFNSAFNVDVCPQNLGKICKRIGLVRGTSSAYTDAEDLWLRTYANTVPYRELSVMFFHEFGRHVSKSGLEQHCIRIGVRSDNPAKFHNTVAWNKLPNLSETVDKRSGHTLIKYNGRWVNKARYVYEQMHGTVPDDCQIVLLNGDTSDLSPDNLYCMKKQFAVMMIRNGWFSQDKDVTLAAIKLCELVYALRLGIEKSL